MAVILAVSPHLDDAVLSYGGRLAGLAAAGHRVIVYTVFAGVPAPPYSTVAAHFHRQWNLPGNPVLARREEDRHAHEALGTTPVHGEFLDAIYRKDGAGRWLVGDDPEAERPEHLPTQRPASGERGLLAGIASAITKLIGQHRPDAVITCAAIGEHIDHLRARDATVDAARRTGVPLSMWADFPYIAYTEDIPDGPVPVVLSEPAAEAVPAAAWDTKLRALRCYKSQLPILDDAEGADIFAQLSRYWTGQAGRFGVEGPFELAWSARIGGSERRPRDSDVSVG